MWPRMVIKFIELLRVQIGFEKSNWIRQTTVLFRIVLVTFAFCCFVSPKLEHVIRAFHKYKLISRVKNV